MRARVDVYRGGKLVARVEPGKNHYFAEQQVSNEMAIHTNWLRAEDVDVIADQIDADGAIYFKVLVKPLVNLIWLAGFVFLPARSSRSGPTRASSGALRRATRSPKA